MDIRVKTQYSVILNVAATLNFVYLIVSIVVVGFLIGVLVYVPLQILSLTSLPLKKTADLTMQKGIAFLMRIQPWLVGEIPIQIPYEGPEGKLFMSNHRSAIDVFLVLSRIPGVRILAKNALFRIPGLGFMMRLSGQINAPRKDLKEFFTVMQIVKEKLQKGERVHIFPEFTRCSAGFKGLQRFSNAPFQVAIETKSVIIPFVLKNSDKIWPKPKLKIYPGYSVEVVHLPVIRAADFDSAESLKKEVFRQMESALS